MCVCGGGGVDKLQNMFVTYFIYNIQEEARFYIQENFIYVSLQR